MEFKFRFMEQIVGTFLVLTVVVFIAAVVLVGRGQDWFEEKFTFYIFLPQGYGLKPASPVKMLNSEIGKVSSIGMDKESRMIVVQIEVLERDADMIREDSEASIESEGLIGGSFIAVSPGSKEFNRLSNGSFIKALPKKTINDYIKELQPERKIETITRIINDLAEITERLKNPNEGVLAMLDNLNAITERIRMGEGTVGKVLADETLFNQIEDQISKIDAMLTNFKASSSDIASMTENLPAMMEEINQGIVQIQRILDDIEKGTRDVPELSRKAKQGMDSALEVVDTIKENPLINIGGEKKPAPERQVEIQRRGE